MSPEQTQPDTRMPSRFWEAATRWRGVALATAALVATIWLAVTGQLILYISPRYVIFTVIMAAIALALVLASTLRRSHSHDAPVTGRQKAATIASGMVTLAIALLMIVVPPATLSSRTAVQRDVNASIAAAPTTTTLTGKAAGSYEKFSVLEWSTLLQQTTNAAYFQGKPADVVGFITPDSSDPANVFYLTRFVITCCAVDAQPVGIPVYLPDWKKKYHADEWLAIKGGFEANPSRTSTQQIALIGASIRSTAKPKQPYLF